LEYEFDNSTLTQDRESNFPGEQCGSAKNDKVIRWQLPVEADGPSGEYYITFPDDLLEAANLEEGDEVEWVDNDNGTFILRKVNTEAN
jgi:hypothetical protein